MALCYISIAWNEQEGSEVLLEGFRPRTNNPRAFIAVNHKEFS